MSKSFTQRIALFLLVIFMTNLGVWGFSAASLTHELEHSARVAQVDDASHQHAHSQPAVADTDEAPDLSQHHTLHAVDHLQLFHDTALNGAFVPTLTSVALAHFTEQTLPLPRFDLPFRPPRSGGALA